MTNTTDPQDILEQAAIGIATLTGIRAQLIDQGWSPANAELIVLEMLKQSNNTTQTKR